MIRRIALTLIPCVALYTVAAMVASTLTTRAEPTSRTLSPTEHPQYAARRSGYIVASS